MEGDQDKQPSGSDKRRTIHDYAQLGDLEGFQKLLQDNPSLLKERNAFVRLIFFFVLYFN